MVIKLNHKILLTAIILFIFFLCATISAQRGIDKILPDSVLIFSLESDSEEIAEIKKDYNAGEEEKALTELAEYFSQRMSERYFFNWRNYKSRLKFYEQQFSGDLKKHYRRADEHMKLFEADTPWQLPFQAIDGSDITPYKLRHLARQHKALDIAFVYSLEDESNEYLNYIVAQVNSLANNFINGTVEKEGNDVFESFRTGYRVFNWLFVYNSFLASGNFDWRAQIDFIKTFYYHGIQLHNETKKFRYGNHHTKGLVALSMISILFPEFDKSNEWLTSSTNLLTQHLMKEIKPDGFQFERSVHYHMGDINNYFYVYYLAKINNITLPENFKSRFNSMFEALVKIALPNKKLPVQQDDTDSPWGEYNEMGSTMTIGTILFNNPTYKYFANDKISSSIYWFLRQNDIDQFKLIKKQKPTYGSVALREIGYYVMRKGWNKKDTYLIISAGLSDKKPDHQHGDMLGIYGYANSNIVLPNYQCRYFLDDYSYFKNSFVKNVALVDSIPQGLDWKGNTGGSGFGKWQSLPTPKVLAWSDDKYFTLFVGSHDAYDNMNISYSRTVLFVKDGFFIIKDNFKNFEETEHSFQQVWQGHYSPRKNNRLLKTTFQNGSGLDIYQMNKDDYSIDYGNARGKGNAVISVKNKSDYSFLTLILPFEHFDNRLIILENSDEYRVKEWEILVNQFSDDDLSIGAKNILKKNDTFLLFDVNYFSTESVEFQVEKGFDAIIKIDADKLEITSLNAEEIEIKFSEEVSLFDSVDAAWISSYDIQPGELIIIRK